MLSALPLTAPYRFDESSKTVFVGDYSGTITVLKLEETECKYVSSLKGHMGKYGGHMGRFGGHMGKYNGGHMGRFGSHIGQYGVMIPLITLITLITRFEVT